MAQNTRGVQSVYRIEPAFAAAQLDSVLNDVRIDAAGMLAETAIVEVVAEGASLVVLDTVMIAKSGDAVVARCGSQHS